MGKENEEEGEEVEGAVTPGEERKNKQVKDKHLIQYIVGWRTSFGGTHLKALYTGRYQQTKEQGVKRRAQRMARPRPTPPVESTQNMAREEIRFKSSVQVPTGQKLR